MYWQDKTKHLAERLLSSAIAGKILKDKWPCEVNIYPDTERAIVNAKVNRAFQLLCTAFHYGPGLLSDVLVGQHYQS